MSHERTPPPLMRTLRTRFAQVPCWVYERMTDGVALRVYVHLAGKYADAERHAFPRESVLAQELGLSERTVQRAIATLRDADALQVYRSRKVGGHYGRNEYWLPLDDPRDEAHHTTAEAGGSDLGKQDGPAGQPQPTGVTARHTTDQADREPDPSLGSKSFSRDKSLEVYTHARDEDPDLVEARGRPDDDAEVVGVHEQDLFGGDQLPASNNKIKKPAQCDAEFDAFWAAYPRKEGGKLEARKAWDRAIKKVTVDQLMAAVAVLAEYKIREYPDPGERKKLTALPTTWLNQGRWDDELRIEDARPRNANGYHRSDRPIRVSATARAVDEVDAAFERVFGSTSQVGLPGGSQ